MESPDAHLDFESRSRINLPKAGLYRYAEDESTSIWLFRYQIGDGPIRGWRPGQPLPIDLIQHIRLGRIVKAHNSAFERIMWNVVLRRLHPEAPMLTIEQMNCTQARAAAVSHPQSLGDLGRVLNTDVQKDNEGYALMMKMAKPRRYNPDGSIVWWDAPEDIDTLDRYCGTDVGTESAIDQIVPPLTDYELRVWHLDQTINDRGIPLDRRAVQVCAELVEIAKKDADRVMRELTGRVVPKCTSDNQIIKFIADRGIPCTTVKKGEQEDLKFLADLRDDRLVRDVIELRADAKKTSTAKYKAMLQCLCSDDRVRGLLNYHGAGPGRWAGRLIQPQNFPRVDYEEEGQTFNWMHELIQSGRAPLEIYQMLTSVYGDSGDTAPMRLLSRALRSMICAPEGKKLVGGDFANIEGRINAWNAEEDWKIEAFELYDLGVGPDLYKLAYAKSFGVDVDSVKGQQRQIGKVEELALGYQGSVGAFITMGDTYGLDPFQVARAMIATTPALIWDQTAKRYAHATEKEKCGLQEREWTAIKIIVNGWRAAHPKIVQSWWDLQDAAIDAVSNPGIIVPATRVSYFSDGNCLWCLLPSGRMICYASPEVNITTEPAINRKGELYERTKRTVRYWGFKEGKWRKLSLYGGHQCENIVQGMARCVMVDRMFAAEEAGYPLILTVHDELLAEVEASRLDLNDKDLERVMSVIPAWANGLPLAAKAWEDKRYVK